MATALVAPALSTPESHIFEAGSAIVVHAPNHRSAAEISAIFEIQRTVSEIKQGGWKRIALQFPDSLLPDAPRVVELLRESLKAEDVVSGHEPDRTYEDDAQDVALSKGKDKFGERLFILGDTSYGACCVDEIAAEHIDADVVVHYGRACLSPTARLPVIYVFTKQELDHEAVVDAFIKTYPEKHAKIILAADVTYASHLQEISVALERNGFTSIFTTTILHNPSSPLPNRSVPSDVASDSTALKSYRLFHIADPPPALLLTLSSNVSDIHIYPISGSTPSRPLLASTAMALRRRYALVTSLSTCAVFGILVNTLSVKNYLPAISRLQSLFLAAGKKAYVFVVGKLNAAKIANFAEIGGWVVIGCWESSLVEGEGFWKPVVTPFEIELLLKGDKQRVWTGEWRGDFDGLVGVEENATKSSAEISTENVRENAEVDEDGREETGSEEESAPPEFDLRTGRYVSNSRPIQREAGPKGMKLAGDTVGNVSLVKRAKGDLAVVGNQVSPGAEFLRSKRTWTGLGSDFDIAYDESVQERGMAIEQGRSGVARGYENERSGIQAKNEFEG